MHNLFSNNFGMAFNNIRTVITIEHSQGPGLHDLALVSV